MAEDRLSFAQGGVPDVLQPSRHIALALLSAAEGAVAALPVLIVVLLAADGAHGVLPQDIASAIALALVHALFSLSGFNRDLWGRARLLRRMVHGIVTWTLGFALVRLVVVAVFGTSFSGQMLITAFLAGAASMAAFRLLEFTAIGKGLFDAARPRAAFIGSRQALRDLPRPWIGPLGSVIVDELPLEDIRHLLDASGSEALTKQLCAWVDDGVDEIVLVGDLEDAPSIEQLIALVAPFALGLSWVAQYSHQAGFRVPTRQVRLLSRPGDGVGLFLKRMLDIVGAVVGILLTSPLLIGAAIAIRLDSPGPILFRQERRGLNGKSFVIFKFRSMCVTESGHDMVQATRGDPRVTRVGRVLRATSIDELPQLFNVLGGEMSLVGPRPHAIRHDDELARALPRYAERRRVKPGITGWAQVHGWRGETTTLKQMAGRTALDLTYVDNWSVFLDIWILILTVISPKSRQNAH